MGEMENGVSSQEVAKACAAYVDAGLHVDIATMRSALEAAAAFRATAQAGTGRVERLEAALLTAAEMLDVLSDSNAYSGRVTVPLWQQARDIAIASHAALTEETK